MEETNRLSSERAGGRQCSTGLTGRTGDATTSKGGRRLWNVSPAVLKPSERFTPHLVSLVVEPDPGDPAVARTSETEDLLGVTPLKHPHATILSSRQV